VSVPELELNLGRRGRPTNLELQARRAAGLYDPPAGELCACGCGRALPTRRPRYVPHGALPDPFATSACCRRFHGLPVA
jgi:hypothetical protein